MIIDNDRNYSDSSKDQTSDTQLHSSDTHDKRKPVVANSPLWKVIAGLALLLTVALVTSSYWVDSARSLIGLPTVNDNFVVSYTEQGEPEDAFTAALIKRLDQMEKRLALLQADSSRTSTSANRDVIMDDVTKQMSAAIQKFQGLDQRLTVLEQNQMKMVQIFNLYDDVQRLIDDGKSFAEPFNQLAEHLGQIPELQTVIYELAEYSTIGIPTYHVIQKEINKVLTDSEDEQLNQQQTLSWWQRMVDGFKNLFHIRKTNDVMKVSSTQIHYALKMAKAKIDAGLLAEALEILKTF